MHRKIRFGALFSSLEPLKFIIAHCIFDTSNIIKLLLLLTYQSPLKVCQRALT
ncbi:hypothetical protein Csa_012296 [Cucumis sativus]|nr:hypothetical protein Csa_012296 [Cucumis sativus]